MFKTHRSQVISAGVAGVIALTGVSAIAVAVVNRNAHVQKCNQMADRAIAEYYEAQEFVRQADYNKADLDEIDYEDGIFALIELANVSKAVERNTQQWEAFEERTARTQAEFETVCGSARVNQMRRDLQKNLH